MADVKDSRKLRTLQNFFYKYQKYGWDESTRLSVTARLVRDINYLKPQLTGLRSGYARKYITCELHACEVALRYIMELHLSNDEVTRIAREQTNKHYNSWQTEGRNTPVHPNRARDNKCHDTYLYTSGSTRVRFPSLKRGRSTWKRFYTMFPTIAKEDNWNGRTSDRYKG